MKGFIKAVFALAVILLLMPACKKETTNTIPVNPIDTTTTTKAPVIDEFAYTDVKPREMVGVRGDFVYEVQGTGYLEIGGIKVTKYIKWTKAYIQFRVPNNVTAGPAKLKAVVEDKSSNTVDVNIRDDYHYLPFVEIQPGTFRMGTTKDEWSGPPHNVQISKGFYMCKTEFPQSMYSKLGFYNNSRIKGDNLPAQNVTWLNAVKMCNELSKLENYDTCYVITADGVTWNKSADGYRLPTEAEWEYACRAGTTGDVPGNDLASIAWIIDNVPKMEPQSVGQKLANPWGLYDILGNVMEWCWDLYDAEFYTGRPDPDVDPSGPASSDPPDRVFRGGSYQEGASNCNVWIRDGNDWQSYSNYTMGFRMVRNK